MEVNITVKLRPFNVPNFVLTEPEPKPRQEGFSESPKYALCDLDPSTLEKLCEEFTQAVFEKAGKQRPPQVYGS